MIIVGMMARRVPLQRSHGGRTDLGEATELVKLTRISCIVRALDSGQRSQIVQFSI